MIVPAPVKAQRGRGPDDSAPHILVVDDDSRIRDLLARYLQEHGYRVTAAVDAASARATMRGLSFDLLILDVMMPQESGIDFARALRRESQVPILMLTARAEPEQRIEGLDVQGRTAIILEDVTTTGGSAMQAVEVVNAAGGKVALVLSILDRGEGAAELYAAAGVPFKSLFRAEEFLAA